MAFGVCQREWCGVTFEKPHPLSRYCGETCRLTNRAPHPCRVCGSPTANSSFCSRSCAASFNNTVQPKIVRRGSDCEHCGRYLLPRSQRHPLPKCRCIGAWSARSLTADNPPPTKEALYKYGYKTPVCEWCGISDWRGQPAPIQLDHVNGHDRDNRLENLRILCANCHSQTDTFCGKNKNNPLRSRTSIA